MAVIIETRPTIRGIAHTGGLLDELIAYWPCNEGIGTTITDVHAGYTGDLSAGGTSFSGSSKLGSYCVESDSYSDYITFGTADMFKNVYDKISISYWIKVDTLPSVLTTYTYHFCIREASGATPIIGIYHNTDNRIYFFTQSYLGEAVTNYTYSSVITNISTFYHVCCVSAGIGNNFKIYINGVDDTQRSTSQSGSIYPYYSNTHFMMNNGGIRGVDGRFDEIAFYSKALTSTDVLNLYNSNLGITYPFTS